MGIVTECWKSIPENSHYEASNLGRIRSLDRKTLDTIGRQQTRDGRILSPTPSRQGYLKVLLYRDRNRTTRLVHRLVAMAWLGECPDGMQVNHKNGDKADNRIENLEYVSPSENIQHSFRIGLSRRGEDHRDNKLNMAQVRRIRTLYDAGKTQAALANQYGVNLSTIGKIVRGERWKWLT